MAALRKRYQERVFNKRDDGPPVTAPPSAGAQLPPKVESEKPPEPATESPADIAAKEALKQRVAEMENAERLVRAAVQQQPVASEPQQPADPIEAVLANSPLPDKAKAWLRAHPEYLTDQEKNAALQYHHWQARREAEEFSDGYYSAMERLLGLRQQNVAPPRQFNGQAAPAKPAQTRVAMSAPVSRDTPSYSTGRPTSSPVQLTPEEHELARTLGLSPQQYREGKERMQREKAAGLHQNG